MIIVEPWTYALLVTITCQELNILYICPELYILYQTYQKIYNMYINNYTHKYIIQHMLLLLLN